ncbi:hypothetical protein Pmani_034593 [Petrolisthes manimaculis]|uniref:Uncharacterized protein n=1 Tax=Petrolisthes manimaculis TaxID=1843537 RepID=A0AAE1NP20_9EUCA|nr:hypothetical protein Pmani_034593 [Petrolisthes manimaculis]
MWVPGKGGRARKEWVVGSAWSERDEGYMQVLGMVVVEGGKASLIDTVTTLHHSHHHHHTSLFSSPSLNALTAIHSLPSVTSLMTINNNNDNPHSSQQPITRYINPHSSQQPSLVTTTLTRHINPHQP